MNGGQGQGWETDPFLVAMKPETMSLLHPGMTFSRASYPCPVPSLTCQLIIDVSGWFRLQRFLNCSYLYSESFENSLNHYDHDAITNFLEVGSLDLTL